MTKRKTPKQTNWFPGHVKPVRKGVYKRLLFGIEAAYSYWDGELWHLALSHPLVAMDELGISWHQNLAWLGLAQDPEAADV